MLPSASCGYTQTLWLGMGPKFFFPPTTISPRPSPVTSPITTAPATPGTGRNSGNDNSYTSSSPLIGDLDAATNSKLSGRTDGPVTVGAMDSKRMASNVLPLRGWRAVLCGRLDHAAEQLTRELPPGASIQSCQKGCRRSLVWCSVIDLRLLTEHHTSREMCAKVRLDGTHSHVRASMPRAPDH